jgi:hypothetical protein
MSVESSYFNPSEDDERGEQGACQGVVSMDTHGEGGIGSKGRVEMTVIEITPEGSENASADMDVDRMDTHGEGGIGSKG